VLLLSEFPQISLRMTRWSSRSTTVRSFVHHFRGRYFSGLDVRIVSEDGELLRELVLDPSRDYQPMGSR